MGKVCLRFVVKVVRRGHRILDDMLALCHDALPYCNAHLLHVVGLACQTVEVEIVCFPLD